MTRLNLPPFAVPKASKKPRLTSDRVNSGAAVAHGTGNAKKLLESVKSGEKSYDFIEVMGCPGGCVTGGGQPIVSAKDLMYCDPNTLRASALYGEDSGKKLRKSHQNPSIKKLYDEFLGQPLRPQVTWSRCTRTTSRRKNTDNHSFSHKGPAVLQRRASFYFHVLPNKSLCGLFARLWQAISLKTALFNRF